MIGTVSSQRSSRMPRQPSFAVSSAVSDRQTTCRSGDVTSVDVKKGKGFSEEMQTHRPPAGVRGALATGENPGGSGTGS